MYIRGQFEKFVFSLYSKERPSPHLHKVPTRSNKVSPHLITPSKVSPLTFQTALLIAPPS